MIRCRRRSRRRTAALAGACGLALASAVPAAGAPPATALAPAAAKGPLDEAAETPTEADTLTRPLQPSTFLVPGTSPYQTTHLLGDWGGALPWLQDRGIDPYVAFTGEAAGNPTGGRQRSGAWAQQLTLSADLDWFRIAGIRGLTTHATVVHRVGSNLSGSIGNLFNVQEIYGGGGYVARLAYLTMEQVMAGGRIDLMAGRMESGTDFAASSLYCSFMNLGLCPNPEAPYLNGRAGNGGFQIFPYSSWGGRVRLRPLPALYLQLGVFELNPSLSPEDGWNWSTSGSTGVQFPVEAGFTPGHGPHGLPGHYKVGALFDTAIHQDVLNGVDGGDDVGLGVPGRPRRGDTEIYALADQMVMRTGPGNLAGLIVLGGFVWAGRATAEIERFGFGGLTWAGPIAARPKDSVGFLGLFGTINERLAATEAIQQANRLPLAGAAAGIQSSEVDLELDYTATVLKAITLKPNLQYIVRPGASSRYGNALVVGFQIASLL
ncbi:MAG: carbohydrate porin [Gluconacetobacter diazotrophicus]|nr:carbohydrate porin [Gluconacetobacter diazotrophicus]